MLKPDSQFLFTFFLAKLKTVSYNLDTVRCCLAAMIQRTVAVRHVRTHAERDGDDSRSRKASRKCPGYPRGGLRPEVAGQGTKLANTFQASPTLKKIPPQTQPGLSKSLLVCLTPCRWPIKESGLLAVLLLLLFGCASLQVAPARLPEPKLADCIQEEPLVGGEAVGVYKFSPTWVDGLKVLMTQGECTRALLEALGCASDTAKALREANTAIRLNNRP